MTKKLVGFAACLALLFVAATAQAHGAPEARELEQRVLADDDGPVGYGEGADEGVPYPGGHDLLALDVREARDPSTGTPSLVFRLIVQHGDPSQGTLQDEIRFTAAGKDVVLGFTTDEDGTRGIGFDRVAGPFPVGDGYPRAFDGWIAVETLGVATGDGLSDITVQGHVDDQRADAMPGTYAVGGTDVPGANDARLGSYTLAGPRTYARLSLDTNGTLAPDGSFTFTLTSTLEGLEQTVGLQVATPDGVEATLGSPTVVLGPGEERDVTVSLSAEPGAAGGTLSLRAVSFVGEEPIGVAQAVLAVEGAADAGDGAEVDSGDLPPGASYAYRFLAPGTFEYHCHPHPWMQGQVRIAEAPNGTAPRTHVIELLEPSPDDAQGWHFTPDDLEIHTGDTVIWLNQGQMVHDVRGFNADAGGDHGDHDHGDHDHGAHDHGAAKDTPMPFLLPVLLVALLLRRARR